MHHRSNLKLLFMWNTYHLRNLFSSFISCKGNYLPQHETKIIRMGKSGERKWIYLILCRLMKSVSRVLQVWYTMWISSESHKAQLYRNSSFTLPLLALHLNLAQLKSWIINMTTAWFNPGHWQPLPVQITIWFCSKIRTKKASAEHW